MKGKNKRHNRSEDTGLRVGLCHQTSCFWVQELGQGDITAWVRLLPLTKINAPEGV